VDDVVAGRPVGGSPASSARLRVAPAATTPGRCRTSAAKPASGEVAITTAIRGQLHTTRPPASRTDAMVRASDAPFSARTTKCATGSRGAAVAGWPALSPAAMSVAVTNSVRRRARRTTPPEPPAWHRNRTSRMAFTIGGLGADVRDRYRDLSGYAACTSSGRGHLARQEFVNPCRSGVKVP
jgi:hypothetical protein